MNTAQFLAADPKVSAWVAASAGTGKTKVLTDRILNLLLDGFAPERILCLTFTKAAAAEMANRLTCRLARWATLPTIDLKRELEKMLGEAPLPPSVVARARHLFTLVLDAPGGMKIQTLHGFCQSVLSRFPLEADIPPHFRVLDDRQAEEVLLEAQHAAFAKPTPLMEQALAVLNPYMADNRFTVLLTDLYQDRARVTSLLSSYENFWDYAGALLEFLEIDAFIEKPEDILASGLIARLKTRFVAKEEDFEAYVNTYLTQKKEIRKKLHPDQLPQAEEIFRFVQSLAMLEVARRTIAVLILFQEILAGYQDRKARRCTLDYDDLIQQTQKLLAQPGVASWVLYKLDNGIDHLLIDEAQDTNAAQWDIIQKLTAEFFSADKPYRTVFAVGDAKQSIYSFQGANPQDFLKLKERFASLSQERGQNWRDVQLDLSYRSTPAILHIVDEVFADVRNRRGVSFDDAAIVHHIFRDHSPGHLPGLVELWPLVEPEAEEEKERVGEWRLPVERVERRSPQSRLAEFLATQIEGWMASKGILPSTNQPVQPRDILILVRKRSILGDEIIRALKNRHIPVAGSDRLVLTDHIAVMDMLALGEFVLLPEDDLTLACVLRSPLIGMSEDDLFTLAYEREGTLWASLSQKARTKPSFEAAHEWLKSCLREADLSPVYEFYTWVLTRGEGRRKFLARLGQEAEDALEEFLAQALSYDQDHASSLQGFVQFMHRQTQEIKRDTADTVHNQVRLMTVHGSKGLQAPIVILPDAATSGKQKGERLLWGNNLVMVCPTLIEDTEKTSSLKSQGAEEAAEEERRLLYVALTRAQDRLYVGGWTSGKDIGEDSWYKVIQKAVTEKSGSDRYQPESQRPPLEQGGGKREDETLRKTPPLPSWVWTQPCEGRRQVKIEVNEKKAPSTIAMERGILIHQFFEYLPRLSKEQRYGAACQMVEKEGLRLSAWERDIHATLKILDDPDFRDIFGPNSLAEVSVSGIVDGAPFQGRIDRLLVTPDRLTIIDYKTGRMPAADEQSIPEAYVKQLDGYAAALATLYPTHQVRKLLLWTQGPKIQEIPE